MIFAKNEWMCVSHHSRRFANVLRRAFLTLEAEMTRDWNDGVVMDDIFHKLNDAYDDHKITLAAHKQLHARVTRWLIREQQINFEAVIAPTGPPRTLGEIAINKQSVHTAAVSEQTNRAMEVLLSQTVPVTLNVVDVLKFKEKAVKTDVVKWYNVYTCRAPDDRLYFNALNGLWVLIQAHKEKAELVRRLLEEMKESVGMCCEGHISRLCNVMVGFDDRFSPPVPVGELLQQQISAIAAKEVSVEEKVCLAWTVFEELKIPMDERDPWIEAF